MLVALRWMRCALAASLPPLLIPYPATWDPGTTCCCTRATAVASSACVNAVLPTCNVVTLSSATPGCQPSCHGSPASGASSSSSHTCGSLDVDSTLTTIRYTAPCIVTSSTTCVEFGIAHVMLPGSTTPSTVPSSRPNAAVSSLPNCDAHSESTGTSTARASTAAPCDEPQPARMTRAKARTGARIPRAAARRSRPVRRVALLFERLADDVRARGDRAALVGREADPAVRDVDRRHERLEEAIAENRHAEVRAVRDVEAEPAAAVVGEIGPGRGQRDRHAAAVAVGERDRDRRRHRVDLIRRDARRGQTAATAMPTATGARSGDGAGARARTRAGDRAGTRTAARTRT